MKILHIVPNLCTGCGISASILSSTQAMVEKGHQAVILTSLVDESYRRKLSSIGVPYFLAPLSQHQKNPAHILKSVKIALRIVRDHRVHLIHSHHRWNCFVGTLCAKLSRTVSITSDHNILYGEKKLSFWADGVMTDSEYNRQHLMKYFKVSDRKIRVVPPLMDRERYDILAAGQFRQRYQNNEFLKYKEGQDLLVGQVARFHETKGQAFLLDVIEEVIKENHRIKFLLLGDGPLKKDLEVMAKKKGLLDHVFFVGKRLDPLEFLAALDLFVISSNREGFCIAASEAILAGLPIISTPVGGLSDQIIHGQSGFLVDYGDRASYKQKILDIFSMGQEAARMGEKGKDYYLRKYPYSAITNQLEKSYEYFLG